MKGLGLSLGIDVSHGYRPIAASAAHLGNSNWPLQTGTDYWRTQNTVIFVPDAAVVASGEVREEFFLGGGVSNNDKLLYIIFWYNTT